MSFDNTKTNRNKTTDLEAEIAELEAVRSKTMTAPTVEGELNEPTPPSNPTNPDEDNWKKRYGDLRTHSQRQSAEMKELKKNLENMQRQLEEATTAQIKFPTRASKDEIAEWLETYPDVGKIVKGIALETASEELVAIKNDISSLKEQRRQSEKDRAISLILKVHPDFKDLVNDPEFIEWVESQPVVRGRIGQALYEALYENETDADAAIHAVNIFKADKKAKEKPQKTNGRDAAMDVSRSAAPTPPAYSGNKPVYKESQLAKMNIREFSKIEADVDLARREGRIVYDLSGAAS